MRFELTCLVLKLSHARFACLFYTVGNLAILAKISQNINFHLVVSNYLGKRESKDEETQPSLVK